jgi:hypothetical protein
VVRFSGGGLYANDGEFIHGSQVVLSSFYINTIASTGGGGSITTNNITTGIFTGASTGNSYVTIGTIPELSNERALTGDGTYTTFTDNGAGNTVVIGADTGNLRTALLTTAYKATITGGLATQTYANSVTGGLATQAYANSVTGGLITQVYADATYVDLITQQTITGNKIFSGGTVSVSDATFTINDNSDSTKKVAFECSSVPTATTRTFTWPNVSSSTVAVLGGSQSFNGAKTFTAGIVYNTVGMTGNADFTLGKLNKIRWQDNHDHQNPNQYLGMLFSF